MPILKKMNIFLKKKDFLLDIKPLLKLVLSRYFGHTACLVDAIVSHCVNASDGTKIKVRNNFRNSNDNADLAEKLGKCDAKEQLAVNVAKMFINEE